MEDQDDSFNRGEDQSHQTGQNLENQIMQGVEDQIMQDPPQQQQQQNMSDQVQHDQEEIRYQQLMDSERYHIMNEPDIPPGLQGVHHLHDPYEMHHQPSNRTQHDFSEQGPDLKFIKLSKKNDIKNKKFKNQRAPEIYNIMHRRKLFKASLDRLKNQQYPNVRDILRNKISANGPNSDLFRSFEEIVRTLGIYDKHRCIDHAIILPYLFDFLNPREVFEKLKSVCKRWKKIIEEKYRTRNFPSNPTFFYMPNAFPERYLSIFSKIDIYIDQRTFVEWRFITEFIKKHAKNLRSLNIMRSPEAPINIGIPNYKPLLQHFRSTLTEFTAPVFDFYEMKFQNLEYIRFQNTAGDKFIPCLTKFKSNHPNLKIAEIHLRGQSNTWNIDEFARQMLNSQFKDCCVTGDITNARVLPLNIVTGLNSLSDINDIHEDFRPQVNYLSLNDVPYLEPWECGWAEYEELISKLPNLRGIALNTHTENDFLELKIKKIDQNHRILWHNRIKKISKKGIKILTRQQIYKNIKLETTIMEEYRQADIQFPLIVRLFNTIHSIVHNYDSSSISNPHFFN